MTGREQYINGIKKMPLRIGKEFLLKSLAGEKLTLRQAVYAHCYDCQGGYSAGDKDCENDTCPLQPFMPYNENRIKQNKAGNLEALAKARAAKVEQADENLGDDEGQDEADDDIHGEDEKTA